MSAVCDTIIRISPKRAEVFVEQEQDGIISRKSIAPDTLAQCFLSSRYDDEHYCTGLLPDECIAVTKTSKCIYYFIRYPELYADFTYYDTEYTGFPIPRLVFAFKYLPNDKKVAQSSVCVVKDERLTMETPLFHYPFSNVNFKGDICLGNNALPNYRNPARLHTLASYILRIPNNNDHYSTSNNKLHLEYRDLLEQMKNKDPSTYYSDVLVGTSKTLGNFINDRR